MKERPILFSAPMVRAILEGRKTQTRRIIKPQPVPFGQSSYGGTRQGWSFDPEGINRSWNDDDQDPYRALNSDIASAALREFCPHGQAGDRLWVRERLVFDLDFGWRYAVDAPEMPLTRDGLTAANGPLIACDFAYSKPVCPSIHMPRKASRITLEILTVRAERLQDITQDAALAEGIEPVQYGCGGFNCPVGEFRALWESINGPTSWTANPWVWVIAFRRLNP